MKQPKPFRIPNEPVRINPDPYTGGLDVWQQAAEIDDDRLDAIEAALEMGVVTRYSEPEKLDRYKVGEVDVTVSVYGVVHAQRRSWPEIDQLCKVVKS